VGADAVAAGVGDADVVTGNSADVVTGVGAGVGSESGVVGTDVITGVGAGVGDAEGSVAMANPPYTSEDTSSTLPPIAK
jgi:hypothetical protein